MPHAELEANAWAAPVQAKVRHTHTTAHFGAIRHTPALLAEISVTKNGCDTDFLGGCAPPLITLHDILERARASGQKLAAGEALWLFAAVTRLAAAQGGTVRSRLVQMDPSGAILLARFDEKRADDETGYHAPELLERGAPAKTEPRVQVYAAGALGYELLTGQPAPDPRKGPGPELAGPFGDLVRIAMARDRRERFGDLQQLREAVDGLQRPAGADSERQAFAALVVRAEKWAGMPDLDRAALAKLIDHISHVDRQISAVRSGMADVQRDQQDLNTRLSAVESRGPGQSVHVRSGSGFASGLIGGLFGAAVCAGALYAAGILNPAAIRALAGQRPSGRSPAQADPRPVPAATSIAPVAPTSTAPSTSPSTSSSTLPSTSTLPSPSTSTSPSTSPPASSSSSARLSPADQARAAAEALVKRGDADLERGSYESAAENFQQALNNDSTVAVAWRGLGIAHLMRHDEEAARKAYEKYLQLAPTAPDARDIRKAIAELNARAKIGAGAEK
jgi:tetratricopeptide (TPR) repeat protein